MEKDREHESSKSRKQAEEWLQNTHLNILEPHANDKVGRPVGAASHSHGSWPRTLWEQLCHKEPRDRARANLEERHKTKDGQHTDVAHPGNTVLGEGEEAQMCLSWVSVKSEILTNKARATVIMMAQMHIPLSPNMWSVRRPILSIRKSCWWNKKHFDCINVLIVFFFCSVGDVNAIETNWNQKKKANQSLVLSCLLSDNSVTQ